MGAQWTRRALGETVVFERCVQLVVFTIVVHTARAAAPRGCPASTARPRVLVFLTCTMNEIDTLSI